MERLGILSGSFNPPTIAHVELLRAAQPFVDRLHCVVPRVFPHKDFFGATLEQRLEMVRLATRDLECSVAPTAHGLFVEIAREYRERHGRDTRLFFLCGADAAERVIGWDYGEPGFVERMLQELELLVAPRKGEYYPPDHLRKRVHALKMEDDHHSVSSTEVRERIARGEEWEYLVPESIVEMARAIYPKNAGAMAG